VQWVFFLPTTVLCMSHITLYAARGHVRSVTWAQAKRHNHDCGVTCVQAKRHKLVVESRVLGPSVTYRAVVLCLTYKTSDGQYFWFLAFGFSAL